MDDLMPQTTRKLMILDLDGTIINGSAGVMLAEELHRSNSFRNWDEFQEQQRLFSDPSYSYDRALQVLTNIYSRGLEGLSREQVDRAASRLRDRAEVRPAFGDFARFCSEAGFRTYVVTSSPVEAAVAILSRFSLDGVFGLNFHTRRGKYLGRAVVPVTTSVKTEIIDGLLTPKPVFSCGIGDTTSDMRAFAGLDLRLWLDAQTPNRKEDASFIRVGGFQEAQDLVTRELSRVIA
jgi:phosphoserine phosphatase